MESNNERPFLDVPVSRREDVSVQHTGKLCGMDNTSVFTALIFSSVKRNLSGRLVTRTKSIWKEDFLEVKLHAMRRVLIENGFPSRLVDKVMDAKRKIFRRMAMKRKPVYTSLPFKDDALTETA